MGFVETQPASLMPGELGAPTNNCMDISRVLWHGCAPRHQLTLVVCVWGDC